MRNLPGRTLVLIGVLVVIALVLLGLAVKNSSNKFSLPSPKNLYSTPTVAKTASLAFSPTTIDAQSASGASQVADVIANTGGMDATGVQLDITFDPKVITNVKILPPNPDTSLFGAPSAYSTLFNIVNTQTGSVFYAIAIQLNGKAVNGSGSVGQLQFSVVPGTTAQSTQVTFGSKTVVTRSGVIDSVLGQTTPLTIIIR